LRRKAHELNLALTPVRKSGEAHQNGVAIARSVGFDLRYDPKTAEVTAALVPGWHACSCTSNEESLAQLYPRVKKGLRCHRS
jgi:hypothetical protein